MKYLMLIYGSQEKWDSILGEDWAKEIAKQDAFNRKYRQSGELLSAFGLADVAAAKLVRRADGVPAVTDGPFLEAKEHLATLYLVDCASEERAYEIAADMPWADINPTEVWPIEHSMDDDAP